MRYMVEEHTVDFIHDCNSGNPALDNEDIKKSGDWEDFTGSGDVNNPMMQGAMNKLFGARADIEGEDTEELTRRGKRKSTYRTRKHEEFIKLQGGD